MRYTDPSGHLVCSDPNVAEGDCSDEGAGLWRFGVGLIGFDNPEDVSAVRSAVMDVGKKFAETLGGLPWDAFRSVYNYMTLQIGSCDLCTPGSAVAGYTYGEHLIRFAGFSDQSDLKRRNHVVHELGHAFKWALHNLTGIHVYSELSLWRTGHPGYPDRTTYSGHPKTFGPNFGFASPQNKITWQQSLEGGDHEEFADQFLGWTYDTWDLSREGQSRSAMMNLNMPLWVNLASGQ